MKRGVCIVHPPRCLAGACLFPYFIVRVYQYLAAFACSADTLHSRVTFDLTRRARLRDFHTSLIVESPGFK